MICVFLVVLAIKVTNEIEAVVAVGLVCVVVVVCGSIAVVTDLSVWSIKKTTPMGN